MNWVSKPLYGREGIGVHLPEVRDVREDLLASLKVRTAHKPIVSQFATHALRVSKKTQKAIIDPFVLMVYCERFYNETSNL